MIKAILKFIAFVIACVMIAIASGVVSFIHFSDGDSVSFRDLAKLERIEKTIKDVNEEKEIVPEEEERTNILIASIEKGESDVILLASIGHNKREIDIIFIPRDTFFKFQGGVARDVDKLKDIYAILGIAGLTEAVENVLPGISINHYVSIDYKGFVNVVDSIGGVTVEIKERMFYEDPYENPPLLIDFLPGKHILDGKESLKYIRYISGSIANAASRGDDLGRITAMKKFVERAIKKSFTHRLPVVIKTALKHVNSDLIDANIASLIAIVANVEQKNIRIHTLPGRITENNFFVFDREKTEILIKEIF
ncbi:MAG: LCP family protein [Alkaliphilus sp.]